jgi:uncharacterized oligopeptide transporter (OPT) family protein
MELLGVESLAVAVGIYLPVFTSMSVFLGGLVRWIVTRKRREDAQADGDEIAERGILAASGLIAGESLIGILLAVLAGAKIQLPTVQIFGNTGSLILYLLLAVWLGWIARRLRKSA